MTKSSNKNLFMDHNDSKKINPRHHIYARSLQPRKRRTSQLENATLPELELEYIFRLKL